MEFDVKDRWPEAGPNDDRELWEEYGRNMLEPGWAGALSPNQVRYIRAVLTNTISSPFYRGGALLRHRWGFGGNIEAITSSAIREVAKQGRPDDPEGNARLVKEANSGSVGGAVQLDLWTSAEDANPD